MIDDPHSQTLGFADYLDGHSAGIWRVGLSIHRVAGDHSLRIAFPDEAIPDAVWRLADIRAVPDQAGTDQLVLGCADAPLARLSVTHTGDIAVLRSRCRNLAQRPPPQAGMRMRLVQLSAAALASVALIIFVLVPVMADQLAGFLPPEGEKALGDATFEQIRSALGNEDDLPIANCTQLPGWQALSKITAKLQERAALPYPLTLHVLDHKMINAFALPGGHVTIFQGLIDAAKTPEQLASVIAHEMGHVVNRDPTRIALRSAGSIGVLGLVFGDFAGGAVMLLLAERLIQASYTQDAEAAADTFAHARLVDAGISPAALGEFFAILREKEGEDAGVMAHFMSHPELVERIAAAEIAASASADTSDPILSVNEWRSLKRICDKSG